MADDLENPLQLDDLSGGLNTQSGTSTQDFFQAFTWQRQPKRSWVSKTLQPGLLCGVDSTSATSNLVKTIGCNQDALGKTRLLTSATKLATPAAPTAVSVGVASGAVLTGSGNRRWAVFVNTSLNWISLGFGSAAVLYSGVSLAPSGGSFEMSEQLGNLNITTVNAIASGAASNLAIQSGT